MHPVGIIALVITFFGTTGCTKPTEICVEQQISKFRLGNVELVFDFDTPTGTNITIHNGNDRGVGVQLVNAQDPAQIVLSDAWIGRKDDASHDAAFVYNTQYRVTIVIYEDVGGVIENLINALSGDFLNELQSSWIEEKYEALITLRS